MRFEFVEPIKLYASIREEEFPFILEFGKKIISANPTSVLRIRKDGIKVGKEKYKEDPFKFLRKFNSGLLAGYVAYDFVHSYLNKDFEEESVFGYYENYFVYDGEELKFYGRDSNWAKEVVEKAKRIDLEFEEDFYSRILSCDADHDEFVEIVEKAKDYIFDGEVFQVVLSRSYLIKSDLDPFSLYLRLRKINPSPYMFLIEFDKKIVGASPEAMASVQNGVLKINPIAGTTGRGKNEEEDLILAKELLSSEKDISEHVMLVDLAVEDAGRVCREINVSRFMEISKYSHVQHIESEVLGVLEKDCFEAIESTFPAGTVVGAPKLKAVQIIDELERSKRKVYGGCVGYFLKNSAEMAIAIRMAEVDKIYEVRAGAGIVAESVPEREYIETERKMAAVLSALGVENDGHR